MQTTLDGSMRIYRYMPYARYLAMISDDQIGMPRWTKWKDPFEGFLFQQYLKRWPNCQHAHLSTSLYCLCFSTDMEKDLIWRSYTPDCDGVRIRTTVGELASVLDDRFVLGKVSYKNQSDMKAIHDDAVRNSDLPIETLRDLFLYKLLGFEHDREMRLLTIDASLAEDIKNVPIDACSLFSHVMCDPRMDTTTFRRYKEEIEIAFAQKGQSVKVTQSTLYDPVRHLRLRK